MAIEKALNKVLLMLLILALADRFGPSHGCGRLTYYGNHLKLHFVSNVDGDHVNEILKNYLKPHYLSLYPRHLQPRKLFSMHHYQAVVLKNTFRLILPNIL